MNFLIFALEKKISIKKILQEMERLTGKENKTE